MSAPADAADRLKEVRRALKQLNKGKDRERTLDDIFGNCHFTKEWQRNVMIKLIEAGVVEKIPPATGGLFKETSYKLVQHVELRPYFADIEILPELLWPSEAKISDEALALELEEEPPSENPSDEPGGETPHRDVSVQAAQDELLLKIALAVSQMCERNAEGNAEVQRELGVLKTAVRYCSDYQREIVRKLDTIMRELGVVEEKDKENGQQAEGSD